MILFIAAWHLGLVVVAIVALAAFLGVGGILVEAWRAYEARLTLDQMDEITARAKREKRSAAAKQGHITKREKRWAAEREALRANGAHEDEVERVLRQLDEQAKAKQQIEEPHGD